MCALRGSQALKKSGRLLCAVLLLACGLPAAAEIGVSFSPPPPRRSKSSQAARHPFEGHPPSPYPPGAIPPREENLYPIFHNLQHIVKRATEDALSAIYRDDGVRTRLLPLVADWVQRVVDLEFNFMDWAVLVWRDSPDEYTIPGFNSGMPPDLRCDRIVPPDEPCVYTGGSVKYVVTFDGQTYQIVAFFVPFQEPEYEGTLDQPMISAYLRVLQRTGINCIYSNVGTRQVQLPLDLTRVATCMLSRLTSLGSAAPRSILAIRGQGYGSFGLRAPHGRLFVPVVGYSFRSLPPISIFVLPPALRG